MKEPAPQLPITHDLPSQEPQPLRGRPLRFLVIGAGSRGNAYARAVTTSTPAVIHAVAEPHAFKRASFGRKYIWGEKGVPGDGQEFGDWREWLEWETRRRQHPQTSVDGGGAGPGVGVDGVFICTLDETHVEIVTALAPLGLHILCEKPLALSLGDCLAVYKALAPPTTPSATATANSSDSDESSADANASGKGKIFSIGHVLRYSPHNILLRKLLLHDRAIGDIVSLEHTEPVGWWHFAHSYVRGNWRRATPQGDGSLLTKSCHDIDFILWLLSSPPPEANANSPQGNTMASGKEGYGYHHPRSITSTGSLTQFRRARKPPLAGEATTCVTCPAERECIYSAVRIYRDLHLSRGHTRWPVKIVVPDIEDVLSGKGSEANAAAAAEEHLLARLREDYSPELSDEEIAARPWYGRCVYEADNNVCDDQVVTITWDDKDEGTPGGKGEGRLAKTAVFHMIAPTEKQCERRGRVYGTRGEIAYDSRTISIYDFATRSTTTVEVPKQPPEEEEAHGGGDYGLARSFVRAVDAVENEGWDVQRAQTHFVGCTLEEAVRSHAVVFAAEEARREEKVVRWKEWWAEKLAAAGIA